MSINFSSYLKKEASEPEIKLRDNVQVLKAQQGMPGKGAIDRHPDGKFKPGPATAEKNRGNTAFSMAMEHLQECQKCAEAGDQQGAQYNLDMAHQYATLGMHNQMMGGYIKQQPQYPMPSQAQPQQGAKPAQQKPAQR